MQQIRDFFKERSQGRNGLEIFLIVALCAGYVALAISANLDAAVGRFHLNNDELLVFDNIHRILHSSGQTLLWAIADGDDHSYGRSLYYLAALVGYWPDRLFGDVGLIIAIRMFLAVSLLVSYLIFTFTFIRANFLRAFTLLILVSLPSSAYFTAQPKPEPLQLLFISIFLYFYFSRDRRFGFYWFFIGLAVGSKISAAPLLAVCTLISGVVLDAEKNSPRDVAYQVSTGLFSICGGFLISVPILLNGEFSRYAAWIYGALLNGFDDSSVTWRSWIQKYAPIYTPNLIFFSFVMFFTFVGLASLMWQRKFVRHRPDFNSRYDNPFFLTLFSFCLLAPVIFTTKRLWDHYLHPGAVLAVLAFVATAEELLGFYKTYATERSRKFMCLVGIEMVAISFYIVVFFSSAARMGALSFAGHPVERSGCWPRVSKIRLHSQHHYEDQLEFK